MKIIRTLAVLFLLINFSLCLDSMNCSSNSYLDGIQQQCLPCFYACQTCQDNVNCISCNLSVNFRILDNTSSMCVPINGYYDDGSNNSVAQKCNQPCGNCFGDADNCSCCISSAYYLEQNSSICLSCTNIQGCIECLSQIQCTGCSSYFYLFNATNFNSTICNEICGDGVLYNLECDDGNLIDGDGCSSTCNIEQFFTCSGGSPNSSSICVYNNIDITTISFLKDETQNALYLTFQVNLNITIPDNDLTDMLIPNFPYSTTQTTYDSFSDQYLSIINYDQDLDSQDQLTLTLKLPTTPNFATSKNHTIALDSVPDNNLAIIVYTPQMYNQLNSLTVSAIVLTYSYAAVCVLAQLASNQLYSLQLFFILQYAYLQLLTIDRLYFSMSSLKYFGFTFSTFDINNLGKYSNQLSITTNNSLPIRLKSLGFSNSLLLNINFSFVVLLVIIVGGPLIYAIGIKKQLPKWQFQGKNILFWLSFYFIIMIQIPAMTSIFISFKYQNSSSSYFRPDLTVSILYLILFACVCTYLLVFNKKTQQASITTNNLNIQIEKIQKRQNMEQKSSKAQNQKLQEETKSSSFVRYIETYFPQPTLEEKQNSPIFCFLKRFFYFFIMIYRVAIVLVALFFSDSIGSNVFCLILNTLILLYIAVIRPYEANVRPIINSSMIVVLSVYFTFQKITTKTSDSFFSFDAVAIIMSLLYLTLLINGYFIIREIVQKYINCLFSSQKVIVDINQNNKYNIQTIEDIIKQYNQLKINNQIQLQDCIGVGIDFDFDINMQIKQEQKKKQQPTRLLEMKNLSQIYLKEYDDKVSQYRQSQSLCHLQSQSQSPSLRRKLRKNNKSFNETDQKLKQNPPSPIRIFLNHNKKSQEQQQHQHQHKQQEEEHQDQYRQSRISQYQYQYQRSRQRQSYSQVDKTKNKNKNTTFYL